MLTVAALAPALAAALQLTAQATVATDKPEYYAGETVLISGSGWAPGEMVRIDISCTSLDTGEPVGGSTLYGTADDAGAFSGVEYPLEQPGFCACSVVATGETSGLVAETSFIDPAGPGELWMCVDPTCDATLPTAPNNGFWVVSLGQTAYVLIKAIEPAIAGPMEMRLQYSGDGTSHQVTIGGIAVASGVSAPVRWDNVGEFTPGAFTLPSGAFIVSASGTVVTALGLAGATGCTGPGFYGSAAAGINLKLARNPNCMQGAGCPGHFVFDQCGCPTSPIRLDASIAAACVDGGEVTLTAVHDPVPQGLTVHYAWTRDGVAFGGDQQTVTDSLGSDSVCHTYAVTVTAECG